MRKFKVGSVVWEVVIKSAWWEAVDKEAGTQMDGALKSYKTKAEAWEDAERFMAAMGGEEVPA